MKTFTSSLFVALLLVGCGGQTAPNGADAGKDANGGDAPNDANDSGPISQCHGYCPQPNGSTCQSDCDCYNKCLGGVCADPIVTSVSCSGDAATCPSGQQCGAFGTCEGAKCGGNSDCPPQQQCQAGACVAFGCI